MQPASTEVPNNDQKMVGHTQQWFNRLDGWFVQMAKRHFPEWYWQHQITKAQKRFDKILEGEKQRGDWTRYSVADQALDEVTENAELELSRFRSLSLLARAHKVGVSLRDDVALPQGKVVHWEEGMGPGQRHIDYESYRSLEKLVEVAEKQVRKERKENWESWSKILVSVFGAIAGLIGVLIGLISILKK
jgi:hypothetical protein